MARRTKKEVEQGTINIKYAPMNITGDTAFKCLNDDWSLFKISSDSLISVGFTQ